MLILLGVVPVRAVAAVAVGRQLGSHDERYGAGFPHHDRYHGYARIRGFPTTTVLLAVAVLLTGLGSAWLLKQQHYWKRIILLSVIVALTQYGVGMVGMIPLSSFAGSIAGSRGRVAAGKTPV